jgi:hypothetical protein
MRRRPSVLVELGVVEQRTKAVFEVLDGSTVTEVALRYGVCRQTLHKWLRAYAGGSFSGLVDKSSKPETCPHQMFPSRTTRFDVSPVRGAADGDMQRQRSPPTDGYTSHGRSIIRESACSRCRAQIGSVSSTALMKRRDGAAHMLERFE